MRISTSIDIIHLFWERYIAFFFFQRMTRDADNIYSKLVAVSLTANISCVVTCGEEEVFRHVAYNLAN